MTGGGDGCFASIHDGSSPHIMTKQLGVTLHQPGSQVTNVMAGKHIMNSKEVRIISHLHIHSFLYENLNCILIMTVL